MAGFRSVQVLLMTCVAAQPAWPDPVPMVRDFWTDSTGASSSVGNVITCTWGVTCRHGFSRNGPDEICESSFECSPAQPIVAPVEPAQVPPVPPVPPVGPGPALPSPPSPMGTGNIAGPPVGGAKPESHESSSSNSSNLTAPPVPSAHVAAATNGTDVPHMPHMPHMPDMPEANQAIHNTSAIHNASAIHNTFGLSNTSIANTSADAIPAEPVHRLRGSASKGGSRRLSTHRFYGNRIRCACGVVCQWGSRMEGGKRICDGPLNCESCQPMEMGGGSVGGV